MSKSSKVRLIGEAAALAAVAPNPTREEPMTKIDVANDTSLDFEKFIRVPFSIFSSDAGVSKALGETRQKDWLVLTLCL